MSLSSRIQSLWRNLVRHDEVERDLDEELRATRELLIEEKRRAGLLPEAARRAAALEFGGLESVKERVRESRSGAELHRVWRDVQHAVRLLRRQPAFALVAILSLAIALGAATATYSWVGHVLMWPPSGVKAPRELVMVYLGGDRNDDEFGNILSVPHFRELQEGQTLFTGWAGSFPFYAAIGTDKTAVETSVAFVTGDYFSVLGVDMVAGRGIESGDDVRGGPLSAVLSYRLWQERFGGSRGLLGSRVNLNGRPFTVVGITGPAFEGPQYTPYGRPDVWVAVNAWIPMFSAARLNQRGGRVPQLHTFARLKPGVDIRAASAAVNAAVPHLSYMPTDQQQIRLAHVLSLAQARVRPIYRAPIEMLLEILFVVALLILVAACINVANFLISHGVTRRLEMGVRLALGATRRQVLQQLLTECLVLGVASGLLGIGFAVLFARILEQYPPTTLTTTTFNLPATIDARALAFGVGLTLIATLAFGLVPALWLSLERPLAVIREREWRWSGRARQLSPRHVLLAVQVALSMVIAIVAALYVRSLVNISTLPLAFDDEHVLLARVNPLLLTPPQRQTFYRDLMERLSTNSAVVSAAAAGNSPLALGAARVQASPDRELVYADYAAVGPGYFRTMKIRLMAGREFDPSDESRRTAIVNRTLTEHLWPGEAAEAIVGRHAQIPDLVDSGGDVELIGIVNQPRCQDMLEVPNPCVYLQLSLNRTSAVTLHVRTHGDPLAFAPILRATVSDLASNVALDRIETLTAHIHTVRAGPRIAASMTTGLAGLTLVLTAIGCIALLWSLINEARRDLAIRLALGSTGGRLIRHIMARALRPYVIGTALGTSIAWFVADRIHAQLYHTPTHDRLSFLIPIGILLVIGLVASYYPARLATRTNPTVLLRS